MTNLLNIDLPKDVYTWSTLNIKKLNSSTLFPDDCGLIGTTPSLVLRVTTRNPHPTTTPAPQPPLARWLPES